VLSDFVTLAYGAKVFAQSDDYSGKSMVSSLIPKKFKDEFFARVELEKHVIVGANSTVMPGVTLAEGTAVGSMSLVLSSTSPWGIYVGCPALRIKDRRRDLLELEKEFLSENSI
jgi:acetyltransferase-like isoleucine patch superfamily enzyme